MKQTVLDLDGSEARSFFLERDSYLNFDLPKYFTFKDILDAISDELDSSPLELSLIHKAKKHDAVNHVLLSNKDGKYAWRKLQLIHPVLYVALVHVVTSEENWALIKKRIRDLRSNPSIICESMPVMAESGESQRATQVKYWVSDVEKESIRLALDYEYLLHTDITDCYGSIYTHSIPWSLHTKPTAKQNRSDELVGNVIDHYLQAMSFGQTNGIPQGSILMDFLAEIILAYVDSNLSAKLSGLGIHEIDYRVLRYRDDYRIFVRDSRHGEEIMKALSEELAGMGMRLNTSKTSASNDLITGSIKPEKLHYRTLPLPKKIDRDELGRQLVWVFQAGRLYANSGAADRRLSDLRDRISEEDISSDPVGDISILINIALDSPRTIPNVATIISRIMGQLPEDRRDMICKKIMRKMSLAPNSGLAEVWLQRVLAKLGVEYSYSEKLCEIAAGTETDLFSVAWLPEGELKNLFIRRFFSQEIFDSLDEPISRQEVALFKDPIAS